MSAAPPERHDRAAHRRAPKRDEEAEQEQRERPDREIDQQQPDQRQAEEFVQFNGHETVAPARRRMIPERPKKTYVDFPLCAHVLSRALKPFSPHPEEPAEA